MKRWLPLLGMLLASACGGAQAPGTESDTHEADSSSAPPRPPAAPDVPINARFDCEGTIVPVVFFRGRAILSLDDRDLSLPQAVSASGARYTSGTDTFWNKGSEAAFELGGRTRICRALPDPWQDARTQGIDFRAIGQEPGWVLEITRGRSIRLLYDYAEREAVVPTPTPDMAPGRTTYAAAGEGHRLDVVIEDRRCQDGMSGEPFPATVTVTIDDRELRGCGRALDIPESEWTVSPAGAGPVRIGMTRAEAAAVLGAPLSGPGGPAECVYLTPSRGPDGLMFMMVGERIVRADVTVPGVLTDAGIGVGATEARVREAYGGRVTSSPHKYTDGRYLTVSPGEAAGTMYRLVFETDGQRVTRYRAGQLPQVEWVEACS